MFNNVKNLFSEILQVVRETDFKKLYKDTITNSKHGMISLQYKIQHLYETNIENGLMHYYSGHYNDALTRFKIMDLIWKSDPVVNYNLGRSYFSLKKQEKAKEYFKKALTLNPNENQKLLIEYYIKKIDDVAQIVYIPEILKEEFYNYNIDAINSDYSINKLHIKKVFDIYNRYIGSVVIQKGEENTSLLDIGCCVGSFAAIIKKEYKKLHIDGIDISEKMANFCKDTKIYNHVWKADMHNFLNENLQILNDKNLKNPDAFYSSSDDNAELIRRRYDVIISMGSFSDFGELSVILALCAENLHKEGLLIFIIPESHKDIIQFSICGDYFVYNKEYIINAIKEAGLEKIEIIEHKFAGDEDNTQMLVIAKKISLTKHSSKV